MPNDAPFDVWNGEDLDTAEVVEETAVEETAMHLDPESLVAAETDQPWSDLTDGAEREPVDDRPVSYFADEEPDGAEVAPAGDEKEPNLERLLERQHYAFPAKD